MKRLCITIGWILIATLLGSWTVMMFLFSPGLPEGMRKPAAAFAALIFLLSLFRWRQVALLRLLTLVLFVVAGGVWTSIKPSNDRQWVPEVAQLPWAEIHGDEITIHNVRDFKYRTEADYDPSYEDRTVNLNDLSEVDILVSYWAGKAIAHVMVSFGFSGRNYVTFSIETRKEKGEEYSAIAGFFRNYELTYVVADERDVVAVRTNHRDPKEQLYVLRTAIAIQNGQKLFLDYIRKINDLREHPTFYNTLTTNCTTQVLAHVHAFGSSAPYNWEILLSGYVPEYLFEDDVLVPNMPLDEILRRSLVSSASQAFETAPNFSERIREGIPAPPVRLVPVEVER